VVLAWLCGCGLEIQAHGIEKDNILRRTLARFVYRNADIVRTVSERLKKVLIEQYGVLEERIVVIPVFVDVAPLGLGIAVLPEVTEKVSHFKNKYKEKFNVLSVARLVPVKNIALQLQALALVRTEGVEAHLHIVGEGSERRALETLVKTLALEEVVTFHGRLSGTDLGALYHACDCFLFTSDSEGYGMVLIEALYAGLPIVTTDVGCVGEVIVHEKNALVTPVRDVYVVAQALSRLIKEEATRARLILASAETVIHLKTFPETIAQYVRVWKSIIQQSETVDE
jgi:glycosyltransferase involved in cell wall biosynthesis